MNSQQIHGYAEELQRNGDPYGVTLCRVALGEYVYDVIRDVTRDEAEAETVRQKTLRLGLRGSGGGLEGPDAAMAHVEIERMWESRNG